MSKNKHGVRIIRNDEKVFGVEDIGPIPDKDSKFPNPATRNRYPILREALEKAGL